VWYGVTNVPTYQYRNVSLAVRGEKARCLTFNCAMRIDLGLIYYQYQILSDLLDWRVRLSLVSNIRRNISNMLLANNMISFFSRYY
jgi:hypothetical protein